MKTLTPKSEAIAYRRWAAMKPIGWDCTLPEASVMMDVSIHTLRVIVSLKGWTTRFRASNKSESLRMIGMDGLNALTGGPTTIDHTQPRRSHIHDQ